MELPQAGGVRPLGDPIQAVRIGAEARGAYKVHDEVEPPPYTLLKYVCDVFAFARSDRSAA